MAWTRKLPSGRYQGLYRDGAGGVRTAAGGPFAHKAAARRAAEDAEVEARSPGWRYPAAARTTWGEWSQAWLRTRRVEASTRVGDDSMLAKHIVPRWAEVPLCDITRHDVRQWAADLRAGEGGGRERAPATVQRIVTLFSASLSAAVDAEVLQVNVAQRLRLQSGGAAHERFLTRAEFRAVLDELDGENAVMARLLAATGMRWGEAAGLHWSQVDVERGLISVTQAWSTSGRAMKGYPKSRRGRDVPILDWLDLPDRAERTTSCGYEHVSGRCRSGLVVTSQRGAVMDQAKFYKTWRAAVLRARIGHVRVHDLRHTYASWLLQAGVPLAEVGRLLGHISVATTQRYAHLAAVPSAAVRAALDDVMSSAGRAANVQQTAAEMTSAARNQTDVASA